MFQVLFFIIALYTDYLTFTLALWAEYYFFEDLFIYFREREWESAQVGEGGERISTRL